MYSDIHRSFLRACANHVTLNIPDALRILTFIHAKYEKDTPDMDSLRTVVNCINENISKFDQQIKFVNYELLGEEVLVFINTAEVDIHKFQSYYKEADRKYFNKIIREIALSEEKYIPSILALNMATSLELKKFTKDHAEELLEDWCQQGYFFKKDRFYHYGPKVLTEFNTYLKMHYSFKDCTLCHSIVLGGSICKHCDVEYHSDCIQKYISKITKCPACKEIWN